MSSHHRRKRSHSRESSHHSSKTKKRNKFSSHDNQEMLDNILATLNELKGDISSCHTRISEMEPRCEHNEDTDSQRETTRSVEQEDDSLSLLAGNVEGDPLVSDTLQDQDPAIKPTNTAIKPPVSAIQPTQNANATNGLEFVDETQTSASGLYDPETLASSWSTSDEFRTFLEKNFRRKLTFAQVCDILEHQKIPAVEALAAPTLDTPKAMVNHIAHNNKKFVQERDKELAVIQRAMLNVTGPLCMLHDRLEQKFVLDPTDLKLLVEQSLRLC